MSEARSRASGASARAGASGEAIGICASTGGPAVLTELLGALPADFALPLLVVQHIASGFVDGLVRMLDDAVALPVATARDDAPLRPGVWLAPDDAHLTLTPARRMKLDRDTVRGRHRPSADLLLESLAEVLGAGAVAVVLTGMGRDGAEGAAAVRARGGLVFAQDETSSAIYGMPRAAVQAGARPLAPSAIADVLCGLSRAAMSDGLEQLADLVRDRSGIVLHGRHRIHSLAAALAKLDPGLDAAAALRRAREPVGGKAFVAALLEAVAVHETFFFRQRDDLDAIDWHALLATARASGSPAVRAWVAGCSTGEEAWTLGILATEALGEPAPVSLLATDLSAAALRRAERGRYGPRAVRHVEAGLSERHLAPAEAEWAVGEPLRRLVRFQQHNLVTDPSPGERFELILCRNVLIYFDAPTVERVVRSLERVLAPGGMLVLGAADRLCRLPDPARRRAPRAARPVAPWRARLGRPARERAPDAAPRRSWRTPARELDTPAPPAASSSTAPAADGSTPLAEALAAADAGRMDAALAATERALAADPLDADAHYIRGVAQLGGGDGPAAAESLRRALYVDPGFALAAFQLGRAYDLLGDEPAARRAYEQALRTLSPDHERQQRLVAGVDLADVASACGARLAALSRAS